MLNDPEAIHKAGPKRREILSVRSRMNKELQRLLEKETKRLRFECSKRLVTKVGMYEFSPFTCHFWLVLS